MHRGAKSVERDCSLTAGPSSNEIQLPDPPPIGSITTIRNSIQGNAPGGGWVSLASAAVFRTRQANGNAANVAAGSAPVPPAPAPANGANGGAEDNSPVFSANFNPLLPRTPIQTNRRPSEGPPFEFNNVAVSNRPLTQSNNRGEVNSPKVLTGGATAPTGSFPGSGGRCRGTPSYDKVAYADYIGARRYLKSFLTIISFDS